MVCLSRPVCGVLGSAVRFKQSMEACTDRMLRWKDLKAESDCGKSWQHARCSSHATLCIQALE